MKMLHVPSAESESELTRISLGSARLPVARVQEPFGLEIERVIIFVGVSGHSPNGGCVSFDM